MAEPLHYKISSPDGEDKGGVTYVADSASYVGRDFSHQKCGALTLAMTKPLSLRASETSAAIHHHPCQKACRHPKYISCKQLLQQKFTKHDIDKSTFFAIFSLRKLNNVETGMDMRYTGNG